MWIFTSTGFVSVVVHRDDDTRLVVRGRDRASLASLRARTDAPLDPWQGHDYAHRVVVTRAEFEAWLATEVEAITYTNFKTSAQLRRGGRYAQVLHDVWEVMAAFQVAVQRGARPA